jgi:hypothetical protein
MTWSVDFLADDWTHINNKEVAHRAISRIEARGRGILLLHDIQPATALALPEILHELKVRGFKIVHVVPATADRPKTVTEPEQWVARRSPEQQVWPRTLVVGAESPPPVLTAPSPENFGIEHFGEPVTKVALAQTFERHVVREGDTPLPPVTQWPRVASYQVPADVSLLPIPSSLNFKYSRPFRLGKPERSKIANHKTGSNPVANTKDPNTTSGTGSPSPSGPKPPRAVGHQLTVIRPPLALWPVWR